VRGRWARRASEASIGKLCSGMQFDPHEPRHFIGEYEPGPDSEPETSFAEELEPPRVLVGVLNALVSWLLGLWDHFFLGY
jgi:hypothetical protein